MSMYENWESVMVAFENSKEFRGIPVKEHYNHHFVGWLISNHNPPLKRNGRLEMDGLVIDLDEAKVTFPDGREFLPPNKIFRIASLLASNPQRVFSRLDILESVWPADVFVDHKTVDVHICYLRALLGKASVVTVKKLGYRFSRDGCTFPGKKSYSKTLWKQ